MRKLLIAILILLLPTSGFGAAGGYGATALTGGTTGCLDAIDGDLLSDGDKAVVKTSTITYHYHLNASSGAAESSPDVISPDTNPGTKRWILIGVYMATAQLANGVQINEFSNDGTMAGNSDLAVPTEKAVVTYFNSQGLPRGYIAGLTLSNDTDAEHDINITAGEAKDSTNARDLILSSEMTKQIDAAWAAGNDAGGMFTGAVAADTWYHVFIIEKDSDNSIDAGFDTSVSAVNIPAGYTEYRRIGSVLTDGSSNIIAFRQNGDTFWWTAGLYQDYSSATPGVAAVTEALDYVPTGVAVEAIITAGYALVGAGYAVVRHPDDTDTAPSASFYDLHTATAATWSTLEMRQLTNTSAQIEFRVSSSSTFEIYTKGYVDRRGRDD